MKGVRQFVDYDKKIKQCGGECGQVKSLDEFDRTKKGHICSMCIPCRSKYVFRKFKEKSIERYPDKWKDCEKCDDIFLSRYDECPKCFPNKSKYYSKTPKKSIYDKKEWVKPSYFIS